nr:probable serine/threonine-protein kinase nek3 isoform X2 [Crassostrea gigas]|eukprot:XP_019930579.1 PREDICTED: probable serine/threonine-protein kinase nek3 [Crassostrea gigas]
MEIYPSKYGRNGNGQMPVKSCSTSFNDFNIQANGQEWKKRQDLRQTWIKTATSEDFRRGFIGRPRTTETSLGDKPYNLHKKQYLHDDIIPSEQNGSTDESLKIRTKYRTPVIIVLVSSCLVTLAVALIVVFVVVKPDSPHMIVMTEGEITVLQNFSDDLHNKQSDAYHKFTADFSSVMEKSLQKEFPLRRKCHVTNLRNGSIIVSFVLVLESENKKITNSSLKTVVKSAMRNDTAAGKILFGNFFVKASSLSFSTVDVLKELSTAATLATITTRTPTTTKTSIPNKASTPITFTQTLAATNTSARTGTTSTTTANIPTPTISISSTDDTNNTNETNPETKPGQSSETTEVNTTRKPGTSTTSYGRASTVSTSDPSALTTVTGSTGNELNIGTTDFSMTSPTMLKTTYVSSATMTSITTSTFTAETVTSPDTDVTNTFITTRATSSNT